MPNVGRLRSTRTSRAIGRSESTIWPGARAPNIDPLSPAGWAEGPFAEGSEDSMLEQLNRRDRLRLVEFVCSFAWADLEIRPEERVFIANLIRRLELGEEDNLRIQQWLDRPPGIDHLDPTSIPAAHRRIFVESIEGLIAADGEVSEEERDSLEIFKMLLVD